MIVSVSGLDKLEMAERRLHALDVDGGGQSYESTRKPISSSSARVLQGVLKPVQDVRVM